jgi:hypothetical protein
VQRCCAASVTGGAVGTDRAGQRELQRLRPLEALPRRYGPDLVVDPAVLGGNSWVSTWNGTSTADGGAVVQVLSHGDHTLDGGCGRPGADATSSKRTRVADWRIVMTDYPSAPMMFFMLG